MGASLSSLCYSASFLSLFVCGFCLSVCVPSGERARPSAQCKERARLKERSSLLHRLTPKPGRRVHASTLSSLFCLCSHHFMNMTRCVHTCDQGGDLASARVRAASLPPGERTVFCGPVPALPPRSLLRLPRPPHLLTSLSTLTTLQAGDARAPVQPGSSVSFVVCREWRERESSGESR